jgi:hypothetical protein
MDDARSDHPAESFTLEYFCSRIPAEICNATYKLILDNTLPDYLFKPGRATSRPKPEDDYTLVNCLHLCSIKKQIREEFESVLMSTEPLFISSYRVAASFATFFPTKLP